VREVRRKSFILVTADTLTIIVLKLERILRKGTARISRRAK
jgi:hypothetical protein